jgi:hypothetical protein
LHFQQARGALVLHDGTGKAAGEMIFFAKFTIRKGERSGQKWKEV